MGMLQAPRGPYGTCLLKARPSFITCAGDSTKACDGVQEKKKKKKKSLKGPVFFQTVWRMMGASISVVPLESSSHFSSGLSSPQGVEKVNVKGMDKE